MIDLGIARVVVAGYLMVVSMIDLRKKTVSWMMLLLGGVLCGLCCLTSGAEGIINRLFGAGLGLILLIISRVTREAVGRADSILVICLGAVLGFDQCIKMLCISLGLCCICCMVGLSFHVITKKYRIPFIPFLFAGFICCL